MSDTPQLRCSECNVEQETKNELISHLATAHLQWLPYQCYFCVKEMFSTEHAVKIHFETFHTTKSPKVYCLLDEEKEAALKILTNRSLDHSSYSTEDEHPFVCRWFCCQKEFIDETDLKAHVRHGAGHAGERPFVCCRCRACYAKRGNLLVHARVKHAYRPSADAKDDAKGDVHCRKNGEASPKLRVQPKRETLDVSANDATDAPLPTVKLQMPTARRAIHRHLEDIFPEETANYDGVCDDCERQFIGFAALELHIVKRHYAGALSNEDEKQLKNDKLGQKYQRRKERGRQKRYECGVCGGRFTRLSIVRTHELLHTGERPYVCTYATCGSAFNKITKLNKHTRTWHKGGQLDTSTPRCKCGAGFSDAKSLQIHTLNCSVLVYKLSFQCGHCDTRFTTDGALQRHMQLKHGDAAQKQSCTETTSSAKPQPPTVYACPSTECAGRSFDSLLLLHQHNRQQHNQSHFCLQCVPTSSFGSRRELLAHQRLKHRFAPIVSARLEPAVLEARRFPCEQPGCSKVFGFFCALQRHARCHTDAPPLQCPYCETRVALRESLARHVRSKHQRRLEMTTTPHLTSEGGPNSARQTTKLLNYVCQMGDSCGKRFVDSYHLKRHQRVHDADQTSSRRAPFACSECTRRFTTKTSLSTHSRVLHGDLSASNNNSASAKSTAIYRCGSKGCGLPFPALATLREHAAAAHSKPFACSACNAYFRRVSNLSSHRRSVHGELHRPKRKGQVRRPANKSNARVNSKKGTPTSKDLKHKTSRKSAGKPATRLKSSPTGDVANPPPSWASYSAHILKQEDEIACNDPVLSPSVCSQPKHSYVPDGHPNPILPERKVNLSELTSLRTSLQQLNKETQSSDPTNARVPSWNVWKERWSQNESAALKTLSS